MNIPFVLLILFAVTSKGCAYDACEEGDDACESLFFYDQQAEYKHSLTVDFAERDTWRQTKVKKSEWFDPKFGLWGPPAKPFPPPPIPPHVNEVEWKRDRVIAAALHYLGLPYQRVEDRMRGHFPARGCGLDCSNFVAWVYNYGLGIKFTSNIDHLIEGHPNSWNAGRFLHQGEPLEKGDLVFFEGEPKHVVIYIDQDHVIDSTSLREEGVQISDVRLRANKRCRPTWKKILCVRRPIE